MTAATTRKRVSLSEREREILRLVVQSFIETAGPVGSRFLARRFPLGLSPASIRNTMSDLEEGGFLEHPYTSAGRIPTDSGYRLFVADLMSSRELSQSEKKAIRSVLDELFTDTEQLLKETSRLLGKLTNLLGLVLSPRLSTGVLERLEVVQLSSSRVMFVVSVRGGLLRTIVVHVESELSRAELDRVVVLLNERLAGLTLSEIRDTCAERVKDLQSEDLSGLVQLTLSESDSLFSEPAGGDRLKFSGAQNIIVQPEFQEPAELKRLIEFIENRPAVINLIEAPGSRGGDADTVGEAQVLIGSDISTGDETAVYSLITANYRLGDSVGTVGVLGPKRMDYGHVVALVEGMAALLSQSSSDAVH